MTSVRPLRLVLLALAAAALAVPADAVHAQEAAPLVKSEVIRLLVSDTYSPEERQAIVRRSCLTFTPTEGDLEDFRRLGAGEELLRIIRDCASEGGGAGTEAASGIPAPPGEVAVSAPAVLEPADTGGVSLLSLPDFDTALRAYDVQPPPPAIDRENLLARVEVPPRLQNPAEVQRLLDRAAPDAVFQREGGARCVLWVFVDAGGSVAQARVERSSGIEAFDQAALEVARSMTFTPGTTGTRPVGMWVQQTLAIQR